MKAEDGADEFLVVGGHAGEAGSHGGVGVEIEVPTFFSEFEDAEAELFFLVGGSCGIERVSREYNSVPSLRAEAEGDGSAELDAKADVAADASYGQGANPIEVVTELGAELEAEGTVNFTKEPGSGFHLGNVVYT